MRKQQTEQGGNPQPGNDGSPKALSRKAPESKQALDKIEQALKDDQKQKAKRKRESLLSRCGCF